MRLLLDSQALLWFLLGSDDVFPGHVRDAVEDTQAHVVVSVASQWELMIKAMNGRLELSDAAERFLIDLPREAGFRVLDIQPRHVAALAELPQIHGDPFDRMLVAQAMVEDLDLVTDDQMIRRYPVRTMW